MKRISTSTKVIDKFGAGKHGFTDGNVGIGTPPTDLEADLFDQMQEEICNPIEAVELVPDGSSREQLLAAIRILVRRGAFSVAAGTADAMTVALTPAATALTDGMEVRVRCLGPNTSTTPTLKLDALAAKTIVGPDGGALNLGAYVNNWPAIFRYRLGTDKFELVNPARRLEQRILVSSGSFVAPTNRVYLSMCGAGGGGGSGSASTNGGGGAGGASVVRHPIDVTPGEVINITIGNGGAGGPVGSSGAAGQSSSFGAYVTTPGGGAGSHGTSASGGNSAPAPAGIPSAIPGGYGEYGPFGGSGGGSAFGSGGKNHAGGVGTFGSGYGSGGAGGGINAAGGMGAPGLAIVEW